MSILLDTNILTRLAQQVHPHHDAAKRAIAALATRRELLHIVPQNLYEFWVVATRPAETNGGLGLTIDQAALEISRIRSLFTLLPDIPAIYAEWERLVTVHEVKGKSAHDARLVAAMNIHGVTQILTFNDHDFSRYKNIDAINPTTFVSQSQP